MKLITLVLVFSLVLSAPPNLAAAQEQAAIPALSLPDLIRETRQVNPDLVVARKRLEAAEAKIPLSKGLPAPKIGVEFEEIPRGTVKINQATAMYQLIQMIPFPGKLSARHKVAVKEAQVAAMEFKKAEWEVMSALKAAYYDLFLLDKELGIQREQALWLKQAEASARSRYTNGISSQAEFLRTQAEALEADNEIKVLSQRRMAMQAHLNHFLNRPGHETVGNPAPVELMAVPAALDDLLAQAKEHQPALLAMKYSAERADAALKLSKRELLPDLETMLELRDPAMGPVGPWDLSLALVLPFWFWTKQEYGVKVALRDKESMEAAYQAMQNEVARRIHENWHESTASYEKAKLYQDALIPQGRQVVEASLVAYQSGKGSFMELIDAIRTLNERRRVYEQQLVSLEQRIVMLEEAVGVPLRSSHEN